MARRKEKQPETAKIRATRNVRCSKGHLDIDDEVTLPFTEAAFLVSIGKAEQVNGKAKGKAKGKKADDHGGDGDGGK